MKAEHPILFSGEMVRAILAGRKTQTRRVVKPQPRKGCSVHMLYLDNPARMYDAVEEGGGEDARFWRCPYGRVGDRLWVRETWRPRISHGCRPDDACDCDDVCVTYAADGAERMFYGGDVDPDWTMPKAAKRGTVPSIHMPRWASRITLEITGVRVERVQAISEADAIAEGMNQKACAAALRLASGRVEPVEAYYGENEKGEESDGWRCKECAVRFAGKNGRVGWGCCPESDGPAYCDECYAPLIMSLSKYGVNRELFLECNSPADRPGYAASGMDAAIAHMIADGIGDLGDEHLGRLAQIGYATLWDAINGKGAWAKNPWVWVVEFKTT